MNLQSLFEFLEVYSEINHWKKKQPIESRITEATRSGPHRIRRVPHQIRAWPARRPSSASARPAWRGPHGPVGAAMAQSRPWRHGCRRAVARSPTVRFRRRKAMRSSATGGGWLGEHEGEDLVQRRSPENGRRREGWRRDGRRRRELDAVD